MQLFIFIHYMQDIIPIFTSNFNGKQLNSIDARNLHEFLEVKTKFATWIQRKIEKYGFIENINFIRISQNWETSSGGTQSIEYHISTNMAKELSMLEENDKGKQARLYFIKKEEQANNQIEPLQIDSKFLLQIAEQMREKEELIDRQKIVINHLEIETKEQQSKIDKKDEENQKLKITIKHFFKGAELFTRRQVCHFLARQGLEIKEQQITDFLNKKKWLCKGEHNTNKATAESCRFSWFVNDISIYERNGRKKTSEYGKFTVDGIIGMYDFFKAK